MFKNHQLNVSVGKKQGDLPPQTEKVEAEELVKYAALVSSTVETVGKTIMKGILIYIAADTARKVIIKSTHEG